MYGTVGRAHVGAENRDRLAEVMMNPAYAFRAIDVGT